MDISEKYSTDWLPQKSPEMGSGNVEVFILAQQRSEDGIDGVEAPNRRKPRRAVSMVRGMSAGFARPKNTSNIRKWRVCDRALPLSTDLVTSTSHQPPWQQFAHCSYPEPAALYPRVSIHSAVLMSHLVAPSRCACMPYDKPAQGSASGLRSPVLVVVIHGSSSAPSL